MKLLAKQKCIEVHQEIGWVEKRIVETSFEMKLYDEMITVKDDQYPITAIFDISYRKKGEAGTIGFIYLHTNRGVRTYYIKEEPTDFIAAYQKLKSERPEL
ncbi:hypothetical protein QA612_01630 [Evansella sp. AB-P1]|uniref:hypothetical protein n=1 Tax=Evansella sp. AB-P1 TaxID=3037653 RepID=UPI00241C153E|nr:hypothetical protein [Evansella sp. AB-P1]MDG5786174.1 hypothetical protein [Evansella sp. AB-P1]